MAFVWWEVDMGMEINQFSGGGQSKPKSGKPLPVMTGDVTGFKPDKPEPEQLPRDPVMRWEQQLKVNVSDNAFKMKEFNKALGSVNRWRWKKMENNVDEFLKPHDRMLELAYKKDYGPEYKAALGKMISEVGIAGRINTVAAPAVKAAGKATQQLAPELLGKVKKAVNTTSFENALGAVPLGKSGDPTKVGGAIIPRDLHDVSKGLNVYVDDVGVVGVDYATGQLSTKVSPFYSEPVLYDKVTGIIKKTLENPTKLDEIEAARHILPWGAM
ncbi:MAG TPA: hypothetical protein V6C52_07835 [Coleofasciculaceae cyanobacterium]|jgi:hypothetical protein